MAANEKPGLLEQNRALSKKHDEMLTRPDPFVKTNWLSLFRVQHDLKGAEMVETIRSLFPGFDKQLLSKCEHPEKYGIMLTPEAQKALEDAVQGGDHDPTA